VDKELSEAGLKARREMYGAEFVDKALASTDDFTREFFHDFANEHVWGYLWSRPGLPRNTRSLVMLAILAAAGKSEEIKLQTGAALRNGCTPEEIKEVFLQAAVYCGVPAGVDAFKAAQPVVAEFRAASQV
jgi:4-carboxymuconolactone decarboxylase